MSMELRVLGALAPAYIAVRGYAAPEAGPVLDRARELCERVGQPPQLFGILLGTWEWRLVRGDIRMCIDLAADGMALAEHVNDPGMLMEALFVQGVTKFYRGEFAAARVDFEKAISSYDHRERTKAWAAHTGHNAGVTHRNYLALTLWQLGYADQAKEVDTEARELADTIRHAFTTAHAIDFTACLYQLLPGRSRGAASGGAGGRHCRRTGLSALARVGHSSQRRRDVAAGPDGRRDSGSARGAAVLSRHRRRTADPVLPRHARRRVHAGRTLRGRAQAFSTKHSRPPRRTTTASRRRSCIASPANCSSPSHPRMPRLPKRASHAPSTLARRRKGRAWELRATMSLARLWQRQRRHDGGPLCARRGVWELHRRFHDTGSRGRQDAAGDPGRVRALALVFFSRPSEGPRAAPARGRRGRSGVTRPPRATRR